MASTSSGENGSSVHHVDPTELEETMQKLPKLLNESAGQDSCCIFRAPPSLSKINENAYRPHIVSIGPFHHGEPQCQMIQEYKGRFLRDLLLRPESNGVVVKDFLEAVAPMEKEIRKSYSETLILKSYSGTLEINNRDLIQMIVLDGCFIIELFCKFVSCKFADAEIRNFTDLEIRKFAEQLRRIGPADLNNPLITMDWVLPSLMRDLLRLENQIPYFVLQKLFDLSVGSGNNGPSLAKLALWFFNYMVRRSIPALSRHYHEEGKHLLDLFRMSYISSQQEEQGSPNRSPPLIQCAKKLSQAGVKFRPTNAYSILDIKFTNGLLEIPTLTIDDFSSSLFLNFVAYEQCCRHSTKYITTYATFMGRLMSTPADAGFLSDRKIVENYFGTDEEVARFFNDVGKEVTFDIHRSYLSKVFEEVNEYYQNGWHVQWAGFRHTYFSTPWSFMSATAAVALLLLTTIQSFYTVYQYYKPPK